MATPVFAVSCARPIIKAMGYSDDAAEPADLGITNTYSDYNPLPRQRAADHRSGEARA